MTGRFQDKVALITGASRGIGRIIAQSFAREGAHIIAVARTSGALEELDDEIRSVNGSATLVPLGLDDGEGIDRLGGAVFDRWKRLDILIGNAGVLGPITPLAHVDPKEWRQVLDINLTANWRLIRAFDPLLREAPAGRAVFVTSGAATMNRAYWGPYAISKAALEAMVRTYANEIAISQARANMLNPGPIRTRMRAKAMPGEDPTTLPTPDVLEEGFFTLASADFTRNGVTYDYPSKKVREA